MALTERLATIKAHLQATRNHLNTILDSVGERWPEQVYADGAQWTIRDLTVHLALAQPGLHGQAKSFIKGESIIPPDFDINRYNKRSIEKQPDMTVAEARQQLADYRVTLLAWLDDIEDEADLDKAGRTSLLDTLTVEQMMARIADHENDHANDIARYLAGN